MRRGSFVLLLVPLLAPAAHGQDADVKCGVYCLTVALQALDVPDATEAELVRRMGPPADSFGYSLDQLHEAAVTFGANAVAVKGNLDDLQKIDGRFVAIAATWGKHFVTVPYWDEKTVVVVDPPHEYEIPKQLFAAIPEGSWLLVSKSGMDVSRIGKPPESKRLLYAAFATIALGTVVVLYFSFRRKRA